VQAVVYCRRQGYLQAKVTLPAGRLAALAPDLEQGVVRDHLETLARVAAGDPQAGPVARMEPSERFGWLAAPSSTIRAPPASTRSAPIAAARVAVACRAAIRR